MSVRKAPSILVFDVNETLIDIESIAPFFEKKFGDGRVLREWFNQLILYSNAITLAGHYQSFFALGQGVLEMLGSIYGVTIDAADLAELRVNMLSMPAHTDVPEGLRLLKEAGFRLMTLTNSPPDKDGSPLERAGLAHFFRTPVQRGQRPQVQACSGGIPPRDGTLECSTIGNLSRRGAYMGHTRRTKCRFLCRTDDKSGKCSLANSWTSAASGCSSRPGADGDADDWVVALITV